MRKSKSPRRPSLAAPRTDGSPPEGEAPRLATDLEAECWRQVGQRRDLSSALEGILSVVRSQVPARALLVRRVEGEPARLVTVAAVGDVGAAALAPPLRAELDPGAERELRRALAAGGLVTLRGASSPLGATLLPAGAPGPALVAPIFSAAQPVWLVVLVFPVEAPPDGRGRQVLGEALGPIEGAVERERWLQELASLREALEPDRDALLNRFGRQDISEVIIGEFGGLQSVMARVAQVAPTDAPVLILGETGSGKEVIARSLHARSRRFRGPVVRVNCGAIPPELVDSELFGHERGAFTGAIATRTGWFERADGGTLFLDEVAELPLAAQVRLLRVLQDGTIERVGGGKTIPVDVRIVAATHAHLEDLVASGRFREDLWYRLSVFPIRLPPLRERLEDLPSLAAHFAERAGRRVGGFGLAPTAEDLRLLRSYPWPGNVRELAAVIERAAILGNGKFLDLQTALGPAPSAPSRSSISPASAEGPRPSAPAESAAPLETLDRAMERHIRRALAACLGRIEGPFGAAKVLGVNPHTLRARMRRLGIAWSEYRSGQG